MTTAEAKSDKRADLFAVRSVLFLPASNPRAIAKARDAGADLVVLDLEDAVKAADKDTAREGGEGCGKGPGGSGGGRSRRGGLADAGRDPNQRGRQRMAFARRRRRGAL